MKKVVMFPFNGELMCFIHVLLNALDMHENGATVKIVIEGAATTLVPEMRKPENMLHALYTQAKAAGLIAGACKACSAKLGVLDAIQEEGLALLDDMKGHPSMRAFQEQGFEVLTF